MLAVASSFYQKNIDQGIFAFFKMGCGYDQSFAGVNIKEIKPVAYILTKDSGPIFEFSDFFRNFHLGKTLLSYSFEAKKESQTRNQQVLSEILAADFLALLQIVQEFLVGCRFR